MAGSLSIFQDSGGDGAGLLVAVLEGGTLDCAGLMLVAVWKVRVLYETSWRAELMLGLWWRPLCRGVS